MKNKTLSDVSNIGDEIEDIIDTTENLNELQSKLILLVQKYLKKKNTTSAAISGNKNKPKNDKIASEITKFTHGLIKKYQELDSDPDKNNIDSENYPLDKKAKIATKKLIKEFALYEIYKVMNPKRIAGETKKDNFAHNMIMGGYKKAQKYEGGKKSDLKSYNASTIQAIEQAGKTFKRNKKGFEI